jgi:hypothetical protein
MQPGFEAHLAGIREDLEDRRTALVSEVSSLNDAELPTARPGGWTIAKVLDHIVSAELHYARLVNHLRGVQTEDAPAVAISSVSAALRGMDASRTALLDALEGVIETDFYRLASVGRAEYSVVSVLENVAQHDHEHLDQVRRIRADATV